MTKKAKKIVRAIHIASKERERRLYGFFIDFSLLHYYRRLILHYSLLTFQCGLFFSIGSRSHFYAAPHNVTITRLSNG